MRVLFLVLLLSACVPTREPPGEMVGYENSSFLYDSCKKSWDRDDFEISNCKTAIASTVTALALFTLDSLPIRNVDDVCSRRESELLRSVRRRVCIDKGVTYRDIAAKYIAWYEDAENRRNNPDFFKGAESSLVISLFSNYKCQ